MTIRHVQETCKMLSWEEIRCFLAQSSWWNSLAQKEFFQNDSFKSTLWLASLF